MNKFNHILIANRGEIASRICKTAKRLQYTVTCIYSSADSNAPHTQLADFLVELNGQTVTETYLDIEQIISAAKKTGANAIHPGYGFLSENAIFAERCQQENIVFIGPSAECIDLMGNKAKAKATLADYDIPMALGYQNPTQQTATDLENAAQQMDFPILIKAAAGGGGRGMRLTHNMAEFKTALLSAKSEALNAFGNDELILERFVVNARHVEVQVVADNYGNIFCFGERDCSLQRRHQKVIEEAPAPFLSQQQIQTLHQNAKKIVAAINYVNAGTIEYLVADDGQIFFIEMNTRLQVEHPVTELIFGVDLVELQLKVAQQDNLSDLPTPVAKGHAIEARLYAEDVANNYLPSVGTLQIWQPPHHDIARTDSGVSEGSLISPLYDPMIAKIIVWGENRTKACRNLQNALANTHIAGIANNRNFLIQCVSHPQFIAGDLSTNFLEKYYADLTPAVDDLHYCLANVTHALALQNHINTDVGLPKELMGWSSSINNYSHYHYQLDETTSLKANTVYLGDNTFQWQKLNHDESGILTQCEVECLDFSNDSFKMRINEQVIHGHYKLIQADTIYINTLQTGSVYINSAAILQGEEQTHSPNLIVAPLHGNVKQLNIKVGDQIQADSVLMVIESMKMEHSIESSIDARVKAIHIAINDQVASNDLLIELEKTE